MVPFTILLLRPVPAQLAAGRATPIHHKWDAAAETKRLIIRCHYMSWLWGPPGGHKEFWIYGTVSCRRCRPCRGSKFKKLNPHWWKFHETDPTKNAGFWDKTRAKWQMQRTDPGGAWESKEQSQTEEVDSLESPNQRWWTCETATSLWIHGTDLSGGRWFISRWATTLVLLLVFLLCGKLNETFLLPRQGAFMLWLFRFSLEMSYRPKRIQCSKGAATAFRIQEWRTDGHDCSCCIELLFSIACFSNPLLLHWESMAIHATCWNQCTLLERNPCPRLLVKCFNCQSPGQEIV